jgi:hypothetical protein
MLLLAGCSGIVAPRGGPVVPCTVPDQEPAPPPPEEPTFGSGTIAFGVADPTDSLLNDESSPFKTSARLIDWYVEFGAWPGDGSLKMELSSVTAGIETVVYKADLDIASLAVHQAPCVSALSGSTPTVGSSEEDVATLVDRKAGHYAMRLVRWDCELVGRGAFQLGLSPITFGTSLDRSSQRINDPGSAFKRSSPVIAWRADFWERPGCTGLTLELNRRTRQGNAWEESGVYRIEIDIGSPDVLVVSAEANLPAIAAHEAGTYVMRYYRDSRWSDLLAAGVFDLLE